MTKLQPESTDEVSEVFGHSLLESMLFIHSTVMGDDLEQSKARFTEYIAQTDSLPPFDTDWFSEAGHPFPEGVQQDSVGRELVAFFGAVSAYAASVSGRSDYEPRNYETAS